MEEIGLGAISVDLLTDRESLASQLEANSFTLDNQQPDFAEEVTAMSIIEITPDDIQWTHDAISVLIERFRQRKDEFFDEKKKKKDVWRTIAQDMNSSGFFVSAAMCDRKWRNLKQTYKSILQHNNQSNGKKRKSWTYLHHFESIFGQDINSLYPNPPTPTLPFRQPNNLPTKSSQTSTSNGAIPFISSLDFTTEASTSGKNNRKRLKRSSSPPPKWFSEYMDQHRQEEEKWRKEICDLLKRQIEVQEQRTAVLADLASIAKEMFTKNHSSV